MNELDNILEKEKIHIEERYSRLAKIYHVKDIINGICQTIYTIFFGVIVFISLLKICRNGLYDWLSSIVKILNMLEWQSVITIMLFVILQTTHSISISYLKRKYTKDSNLNKF